MRAMNNIVQKHQFREYPPSHHVLDSEWRAGRAALPRPACLLILPLSLFSSLSLFEINLISSLGDQAYLKKRVENFPIALLFSQAPFPGLVISLCPCAGVHDCSLQGIWQTAAGEGDWDVWFPGFLSITLWSCDREGWEMGSLYSASYGCMRIIGSRGAGGQNRDSPLGCLHCGPPCCLSATQSSASHRKFPEHWGSYWR